MASFVYLPAIADFLEADADLEGDIRVLLVMANTTADTEKNVSTLDGFTTLDEMDASGYARVAMTGEAVTVDSGNERAEFDANNVTFSSLNNGTRKVAGAVIYRHVDGTDANDQPIAFLDLEDFHNGGVDFTLVWDDEGILQAANA